jgi:hypothetical protein
VVNRCKPNMKTPVVSRYRAPATIDDFVLLFLPPRGPHLTPLAAGSLQPSLLVSPLLGGPARHRPFTPALHLHQRKSSRNLACNTQSRVSPHHFVNHSSQPDRPPTDPWTLWSSVGHRSGLFGSVRSVDLLLGRTDLLGTAMSMVGGDLGVPMSHKPPSDV